MHVTPRLRVDFHISVRKKPSNEKKKTRYCHDEEVNHIISCISYCSYTSLLLCC